MSIKAFFAASLIVLLASIAFAVYLYVSKIKGRKKGFNGYKAALSPFSCVIIGVFAAAFLINIPLVYESEFVNSSGWSVIKCVLVAVQKTLQLFTVDADFDFVRSSALVLAEGKTFYTVFGVYAAFFYFAAPIIIASVVLSFFKNIKAYAAYYLCRRSDIYFISELNSRSIVLAEDIIATGRANKERRLVVFTDVFEKKEEETNYELVERARDMGCILFAKDITCLRLRPAFGNKIKRKVYFIGENEDENIRQALKLISDCRTSEVYNTENTEFYVFSRSFESEVLLNSLDNGSMKVRRIDENRNFVLRTLTEHPIFADAIPMGDKKLLNIAVVGVGKIGTEMVKALSWIGQMYGYELHVHIFDAGDGIEEKLRGIAPELIKLNNAKPENPRIEGEPYYELYYYDNTDVHSQGFLEKLDEIGDISTAYVTLGDDELNIETAMRMRMQFEREKIIRGGHVPSIYAVVYSEIKNEIITAHGGLRTFKNDDYGITLVGSLRSSYRVSAIEQMKIEKAGLSCHLKWASSDDDKKAQTDSYSKIEYYRRSSMAEAIHTHLRGMLGLIPGKDSETDKKIYEYEHNRWSAFIRSEGYVYADKKSDLAKTHNCLIPYSELEGSVRLLDQIVVTEIMNEEE